MMLFGARKRHQQMSSVAVKICMDVFLKYIVVILANGVEQKKRKMKFEREEVQVGNPSLLLFPTSPSYIFPTYLQLTK